jgi:S-adenosylmethionine decarboxylase
MCGDARPEMCIEVLNEAFRPEKLCVKEILRGKDA